MSARDLSIIITEKPGMAKKVACALCSLYPCNERECTQYNRDIFVHHLTKTNKENHPVRLLRCRLASLPKNRWRSYWHDPKINWSRVSLIHSDSVHGSGDQQVVRSLRQILSRKNTSQSPKAVMESVDWYTIRNGYLGRDWMVIHTMGNPQHLDMHQVAPAGEGATLMLPIHPRYLAVTMKRLPLHSRTKSTRMRLAHISNMLRLSRSAGHRVYIATDMDIAGTFLASTLPDFLAMAKETPPLRVCLNEATVRGVRQAIQDAGEFDWHNAEAGRLRDVIDFIIGRTLNHLIHHTSKETRRAPSFTVGRTRLLALDCLYRRWLESSKSETYGSVFLLFPGVGDRPIIEKEILNGSAIAVAAEIQRGPFSSAGFIRDLLRSDVGTVSTRYKLIASLLQQDLIHQHGEWLVPSPKGLIVEQYYYELLESSDFSLWDWHDRMALFLASADKLSGIPLADLEQQVDAFLLEFMNAFRKVQESAGSATERLCQALAKLPVNEQTAESININNGTNSSADYYESDVLNLEGAIPMNQLAPYVNTKKNLMSTTKKIQVSRTVPPVEVDWEGLIRRQLLIEREVEFRVVSTTNLERLMDLDDVLCTLFRADCNPSKLSQVLRYIAKGKAKIKRTVNLIIPVPEEETQSAGAHGPLDIFDPCPADMLGPEAFLVAKEYMRPYEHTLSLMDAQESQQEMLRSFKCSNLDFRRIDPFKFGTAHTFDTLLATMYDRYGMPFERTAEIAESLYLSGGST